MSHLLYSMYVLVLHAFVPLRCSPPGTEVHSLPQAAHSSVEEVRSGLHHLPESEAQRQNDLSENSQFE